MGVGDGFIGGAALFGWLFSFSVVAGSAREALCFCRLETLGGHLIGAPSREIEVRHVQNMCDETVSWQ